MVRKKPASDLKMKICNESLSRGKYILEKKEKANLVRQMEKKIKRHAIGCSKEKTPLGLLSYDTKTAQY